MGKACGLPCHKLLGGYRDSIEPSRILWLTSDEVMVDQARELSAKGYRAFKVKGGLDPDADIRRVHALRRAVTSDTRLYIDGNQSYTYFGAKKVHDALRGELDYFEEPIAATNEKDRVRLAHAIDIPIAGDESNFTLHDIAHQIDIDALSIMMIKIPRSGFTYGRKIAAHDDRQQIREQPGDGHPRPHRLRAENHQLPLRIHGLRRPRRSEPGQRAHPHGERPRLPARGPRPGPHARRGRGGALHGAGVRAAARPHAFAPSLR